MGQINNRVVMMHFNCNIILNLNDSSWVCSQYPTVLLLVIALQLTTVILKTYISSSNSNKSNHINHINSDLELNPSSYPSFYHSLQFSHSPLYQQSLHPSYHRHHYHLILLLFQLLDHYGRLVQIHFIYYD